MKVRITIEGGSPKSEHDLAKQLWNNVKQYALLQGATGNPTLHIDLEVYTREDGRWVPND